LADAWSTLQLSCFFLLGSASRNDSQTLGAYASRDNGTIRKGDDSTADYSDFTDNGRRERKISGGGICARTRGNSDISRERAEKTEGPGGKSKIRMSKSETRLELTNGRNHRNETQQVELFRISLPRTLDTPKAFACSRPFVGVVLIFGFRVSDSPLPPFASVRFFCSILPFSRCSIQTYPLPRFRGHRSP
jgi:hypothetical protein